MATPRFRAEDPSRSFRVTAGRLLLVGAGSPSLSLLARAAGGNALHRAERTWARAAARILDLEIAVDGVGNIDPDERYIVASLHEGLTDVLALLRLPLGLRFVARDELFEWPALGRYLRASQQIRVDEPATLSSSRRLYREAAAALAAGDNLVVFPQGSILGVEVAFQAGAFRVARRFGRPVLPVVLTGSHRVWEHPFSSTVRLGQRIAMQVLPPIAATDLDPATVRRLERTMKTLALDSDPAPRRFRPDRDGWWEGYRYEIDADFAELRHRVAEHRAGRGSASR